MNKLIPKHQRKSPVNRFSLNERKQIYNVPKTGVKSVDDRAENRTKLKTPYQVYKQKRTRVGAASPEAQKEALKARQRKLKEAGYYTGKIDGIWGKKSKAAQAAYDRDNGKSNQSSSSLTGPQAYRRIAGRPELKEFVVPEVPNHRIYRVFKDDTREAGIPFSDDMELVYQSNKNGRYGVLDKPQGTLITFENGSPTFTSKVGRGKNKGDGVYDYSSDPRNANTKSTSDTNYYAKQSSTTPAGVFTVIPVETSDYYGHEPMFRLATPKYKSPVAFHAPPGVKAASTSNFNKGDNPYVSTGCIRGECGNTTYVYRNRLLQKGDPFYITPETEGNYFTKDWKGNIKLVLGDNNAKTYTTRLKDGSEWTGNLLYLN